MDEYPTVMVIAPNAELRRSIAFLLEAEGYAVTVHTTLLPDKLPAVPRRRCAVVDDAALRDEPEAWSRLPQIADSFVMLLDGTRELPAGLVAYRVEKPLLGLNLVEAVRNALWSVSGRST